LKPEIVLKGRIFVLKPSSVSHAKLVSASQCRDPETSPGWRAK